MKEKFTVTGMTCSACSAHVEKAVRKVPGVTDVSVNLLGGSMLVEHGPDVTDETIVNAVVHAGYGASPAAASAKAAAQPAANNMEQQLAHMKRRLISSFCFLIPLFYLAMGHMMGWPLPAFFHDSRNALSFALIQLLLVLPILYINDKVYFHAIHFFDVAGQSFQTFSVFAVRFGQWIMLVHPFHVFFAHGSDVGIR